MGRGAAHTPSPWTSRPAIAHWVGNSCPVEGSALRQSKPNKDDGEGGGQPGRLHVDGRDSGPPWRGSGRDAVAESVGSPSAWGALHHANSLPASPHRAWATPRAKKHQGPCPVCSHVTRHSPSGAPSWGSCPREGPHLSLNEPLLTQISVS